MTDQRPQTEPPRYWAQSAARWREQQSDTPLRRFLGGSPAAVAVKLVLVSFIVGALLMWLNISPADVFAELSALADRLYALGFRSMRDVGTYIVAGAAIVIPVWLVIRLLRLPGTLMASAQDLLQQKLVYVYQNAILLLPNIVIGLIVLAVFYGGGALAHRTVQRVFHARKQFDLGDLLGGFTRWAVIGLGSLVAATIIFPSVKPGDALATLGFGSVAIGFAFKDILQNWFAGLLILIRQPFRRGDQIVVDGYEGTVEHIQARATSIKTYDGRRVVIPNSDVYTKIVTVNTAFKMIRSSYDVGIGYGDDIETARSVILDALDGLEGISREPAPEVIPWDLAGSSVNLRVRWWTNSSRAQVVLAKGRVIAAVRNALVAAQIDMPYPTQVVLFHNQTEETDGDRSRQREGWPAGASPPASRAEVLDRRNGHAVRSDAISSEGEL